MAPGQDQSEEILDLVIDSAGKVRSVEPAGKAKRVDAELINAASAWKFVPAYKDGRPVASRLRFTVSPKQ
jgi:outer membrane biosynthesis protein TonB